MNGEGRANNWLFTEWMADGCLFWCGVQIAIIIEQKGVCLNGTKRQPKVHYTVIFFSFWALPFIRFSFSRFFSCQNDHTSHSIGPSSANKINNIWRQQAENLQQFWYIKKHSNLPIRSFSHFSVRHFIWYYCFVTSPNCQCACRTNQDDDDTNQNKRLENRNSPFLKCPFISLSTQMMKEENKWSNFKQFHRTNFSTFRLHFSHP